MPHNANSHTTVIVNTRPRTWTSNYQILWIG